LLEREKGGKGKPKGRLVAVVIRFLPVPNSPAAV
jgi:hypothetical protein